MCTNWVFRVCVLQPWVVSRSEPRLPLLIEDASRPVDETAEVSNSYYCPYLNGILIFISVHAVYELRLTVVGSCLLSNYTPQG